MDTNFNAKADDLYQQAEKKIKGIQTFLINSNYRWFLQEYDEFKVG